MSTATEQTLFKLCAEQPLKVQLQQLNLQFIKDPSKSTDATPEQEVL